MLYVVLFIGLGLLLGSRSQRRAVLGLALILVLGVIGLFAVFLWQKPSTLADLYSAFVYRSGTASFKSDSPPFTLIQYIQRQIQHFGTLATPSLLILAAIGVRPSLTRRTRLVAAMMVAL